MDGPDDREAGARAPSQPLRLRQAVGRLLLLVPRNRVAQEGVPGHRQPLVTRPPCLPTAQPGPGETNVNDSIEIIDSNIVQSAFLF